MPIRKKLTRNSQVVARIVLTKSPFVTIVQSVPMVRDVPNVTDVVTVSVATDLRFQVRAGAVFSTTVAAIAETDCPS